MIRRQLQRFVTVVTTAALALIALGVAPAAAANPTWDVSFDRLPNVVAPGNAAGWEVTVRNNGPSQINDLNISIAAPDASTTLPSYFSGMTLSSGGSAVCGTTSGTLVCNVGSLVDDATAIFTVAFGVKDTHTGGFALNIGLVAGTGDTGSDGPGKSRGDRKTFSDSTPVSQGANFDGGFVLENGPGIYQTNQDVGRRNIQATTIDASDDLIGVTIEDGITSGVPCSTATSAYCGRLFGEWSSLNVDDGAIFAQPFKVTLLVTGSAVPGGTSADEVVLVHVLDDGSIDVIGDSADETCDSATGVPTNAECILVTRIGSNYQIVAWLFGNGSIRGGI